MKFAVSIPPFAEARTLVDLAVDAEESGWDGVLVWDHVQWDTHMELDVHDPWALLSAMAMRTERVVLGTGVTPISRRRPWIVAKQLTTLDHLSNGRAMLGVGLGEPGDADFSVFGDEGDRAGRAAITDDGLALLDALLRGDVVSHHGPHFTVDGAQLRPRSVQAPRPPIIVAGTHPYQRPVRRALQWDGYFPISYSAPFSPETIGAFLAPIDRPEGWQVWCPRGPDGSADEYEHAGVTWLVDGAWPEGDWVDPFRRRIREGPLP